MRCGDTVKHGPTGETWTVAYADGDRMSSTSGRTPIAWSARPRTTLSSALGDGWADFRPLGRSAGLANITATTKAGLVDHERIDGPHLAASTANLLAHRAARDEFGVQLTSVFGAMRHE